jgi:hypothetical protein
VIARPAWLLAGALALALAGCGGGQAQQHDGPDAGGSVALVSSLPLVMPESDDIAGQLADRSAPHWALAALRERGEIKPLDSLAHQQGALPLPAQALLVMVQPWPLSPQENVALDDWVRAGGRVLLFADPMLTFESRFALGDRRRPQDVAMLSPILARWGLRLERDEEIAPEPILAEIAGASVPVILPGRFALIEGSTCALESQGLLADCRIGRGRVVAIADAALFEMRVDDAQQSRAAALRALLLRLSR